MHEGPDVPIRALAGVREQDEAFAESWGLTRCGGCALEDRRDETWCGSKRPENFNGLMIIGEGPGATEARLKEPFVGASGRLLDAILAQVGIRREETYLANATLCFPPFSQDKKAKAKILDDAVERCNARLRHEIQAIQPRVIVVLGTPALRAVTGAWVTKTKRFPLFTNEDGTQRDCPHCAGERTLPWWKCTACKHPNLLPGGNIFLPEMEVPLTGIDPRTGRQEAFGTCQGCGVIPGLHADQPELARVQKRKKRCPVCEGKKTYAKEIDVLEADYTISKVAGLVFRGMHAPDFFRMEDAAKVDLPCRYVVPSWHPSALLRESESKAQKQHGGQFLVNAALMHFRKALRLLTEDADWELDYVEYPIAGGDPMLAANRNPQAFLGDWFEYLRRTADAAGLPISVDIETDNKDPWSVTDITCIGFHVINPNPAPGMSRHGPGLVVRTRGLRAGHAIVETIRAFIESQDPKSLQHGIYDKQVMWHVWNGTELDGWVFDTMVAHNAVHPDEPHKLGHIAGCYTDSPPWKPTKKQGGVEVWESEEQLHAYNARDIYNTSLATRALSTELALEDAEFVHRLDLQGYHVAADMERAGLPVSPERWTYWERRSEFYKQRALTLLRHFTGKEDFNPASPVDVPWALYDPSGPCRLTPSHYSEKTGKPSASKEALLTHKGHPFVDLLLDYRRWSQLKSTIFDSMKLGSDWRLRTKWNITGARTGRMSTGKGDTGDSYEAKGNFQNWSGKILLLTWIYANPRDWERIRDGEMFSEDAERYPLPLFGDDANLVEEQASTSNVATLRGIRDVIVAPEGRTLVGADSSQAELRALAALCGDPILIQKCKYADEDRKLEPEHDPHSYVCSFAFGEAFTGLNIGTWDPVEKTYVGAVKDDVIKRKQLRDLEKRVIYGSFYGAGAETILQSIYDGGWDGPPLTKEDVEGILDAIWRAFPKVRPWREGVFKDAEATGRLYDPLIKRRREFPLKKVDATVAYNFKLQACIGSLMGMSLVELRYQLPFVDPTAKIVAQVHDAIYIECAEEKADEVGALLERCMSTQLRLVEGAEMMPFPAAYKAARVWGDL